MHPAILEKHICFFTILLKQRAQVEEARLQVYVCLPAQEYYCEQIEPTSLPHLE